MIQLIILILLALVYIFLMPRDIRRSMGVFVFSGVGVLILAIAISQAVTNQSLILELLIILAGIGVTVKAWIEVGQLNDRSRRRNRRK